MRHAHKIQMGHEKNISLIIATVFKLVQPTAVNRNRNWNGNKVHSQSIYFKSDKKTTLQLQLY